MPVDAPEPWVAGVASSVAPKKPSSWWALWGIWTGATAMSMFLACFSITFGVKVWSVVREDGLFVAMAWSMSASIGTIVGTGQFLALRRCLPGSRWLAWIPLTVAGYTVTFVGLDWFFQTERVWASPEGVAFGAFTGILIGGLQAPFLANRIPGFRWWIWVCLNIVALEVVVAFTLDVWRGFFDIVM